MISSDNELKFKKNKKILTRLSTIFVDNSRREKMKHHTKKHDAKVKKVSDHLKKAHHELKKLHEAVKKHGKKQSAKDRMDERRGESKRKSKKRDSFDY